jgi:tetratricopeptide (TPR) repeat protein
MFDHYLHSSLVAWRTIGNLPHDLADEPPARGVVIVRASALDDANEWFGSEYRVLLAVMTQAEASGADALVWRLAMSMHMSLLRGHQLREAEAVDLRGLAAAQRAGEAWAEARLSRFLAATFIAQRRLPEAERHIRISLAYEREIGALREESNVLRGLAFIHELQGRPQDALAVLEEFLPRSAGLSGDQEEANYLSALGTAHHRLGEHERALEVCLRAVAVFAGFSDQRPAEAEATVFETLGDVHLELGRHTEAIGSYREALWRLREMRALKDLAVALVKLARIHLAAGDSEAARGHLVEAESIYEELDSPAVGDVRELLASVGSRK